MPWQRWQTSNVHRQGCSERRLGLHLLQGGRETGVRRPGPHSDEVADPPAGWRLRAAATNRRGLSACAGACGAQKDRVHAHLLAYAYGQGFF